MKLNKFFSLAILIICLILTSCSQDDDGIFLNNPEQVAVVHYTDLEYDILNLVNEHRINQGLAPLEVMNIITKEAISHTDYMVDKGEPSHDNFGIRFLNLKENAKATNVSENIAYGYQTAEAVVRAWLSSDRHRAIIEHKEFTDFGISTKSDREGRNYFTHIFVKR